MLNNNLLALGLTMLIAFAWLRINDFSAHKNLVPSDISRKIIHIGTGPIFVMCWLFFNSSPGAPFLAAVVPLLITLQFAMVGYGVIKDPSAVEAMSRTGDRREILRGPLFYGIGFVILTLVFWRNSPIVGGWRLPWSPRKTLAGSLTMLLGGFTFSVLIVWLFIQNGYFELPITSYLLPISVIALSATLVESLPFNDIDNITVPLVSVLLGLLVL